MLLAQADLLPLPRELLLCRAATSSIAISGIPSSTLAPFAQSAATPTLRRRPIPHAGRARTTSLLSACWTNLCGSFMTHGSPPRSTMICRSTSEMMRATPTARCPTIPAYVPIMTRTGAGSGSTRRSRVLLWPEIACSVRNWAALGLIDMPLVLGPNVFPLQNFLRCWWSVARMLTAAFFRHLLYSFSLSRSKTILYLAAAEDRKKSNKQFLDELER